MASIFRPIIVSSSAILFATSVPGWTQTTVPATPTPSPAQTTTPFIPQSTITRSFDPSRRQFPLSSADFPFASSKRLQDNYQQVQAFAQCATKVGPDRARRLLDAAPNTATERFEYSQLRGLTRGCLSYGYSAPVVFIRGGLSEAMYRREPVAMALYAGGTTPAALAAFQRAEDERGGARLSDDRLFTRLANCLVVRSPAAVRSLLFSRHGSRDELTAINAVIAGGGACTNARSFPAAGSRSFFRAYIAEAAYRWTNLESG